MFHSARLKLTAWYLLIIIVISLSFSAVIYRFLTFEVERFSRVQRFRIERRLEDIDFPPRPRILTDPDLIKEIKRRILTRLAQINLIILIIAGGLGYFLAGRTLAPIGEMVEEQNRFISDASHELRTPLTALKTSTEVGLRDKALTLEQAKKMLRDNLAEVDKLQSLSDNLLELAQGQSLNNQKHHTVVAVDRPINQAVKKISSLARQKKITIKKKLVAARVKGDFDGLERLFTILLDNAVKYGFNQGLIEIFSQKTERAVAITVKDNGPGIAKKDLPHIFDRFYRAEPARDKSGYGLGLSIAKKIVEEHRGTIKVNSQVNKGTTVTVNLPLS